jgi:hypothetical protein
MKGPYRQSNKCTSEHSHDVFLELVAVSVSGELTEEQREMLAMHLPGCSLCREAMREFQMIVVEAISAVAPDPESVESDPSWSQEQAEAALFQRLALEEELGADRRGNDAESAPKNPRRVPLSVSQATWRSVWTLYAASVLLLIALGVSAYQVGIHRAVKATAVIPAAAHPDQTALEKQVSDAGYERETRAQMAQRDHVIADLRQQLGRQSAEVDRMKLALDQMETDLQTGEAGRQDLLRERVDQGRKLEEAQAKTQRLQENLDFLERQSLFDKQRATMLEAKVTDLSRQLHDREAAIDQQQELLAHDRDIRDLMGARDLYIAEVYDVERTGKTRKPYGRVFYTKGKSLIFYAYDLDQQASVKNASTFQAWGRRGPDRQQALNLGVFYVDNASKKRWVLRFDDPKALAQIDAVFVTVEPNGGSQKPSNKSLLFASLHIDPNHP